MRIAHPSCWMTLGVLLVGVLPGCGPKNFANDNDRLRRENLDLQRQVEGLNAQLALRAAEVESWRAEAFEGALPAGAEPPVLAGIEIDRYSGPVDVDLDGVDDVVRVYVRPVDQKGRMLPVAGTLSVRLVSIPTRGEPAEIAQTELDPEGFDAAYREGFTGPYYRVELTLPAGCPDALAARVVLAQAGTAVSVSDQAGYRVRTAP